MGSDSVVRATCGRHRISMDLYYGGPFTHGLREVTATTAAATETSDADTKKMEEMARQGRGHYQYEM